MLIKEICGRFGIARQIDELAENYKNLEVVEFEN